MKIALVHLTDIHFSTKTSLLDKTHSFVRAVIDKAATVKRVYFVISGDIAWSGQPEEYQKAKEFLSVTKQLITAELPGTEIKYVIVPGNHDCDFSKVYDTQVRKTIIQNVSYSTFGEDTSIVDLALTVQTAFWKFYSLYNPVPEDKLFYNISDSIDGQKINFYCLNTAWMSQRNEVPSGLFFPARNYGQNASKNKGLSFGVWHHPYNWFTPNTIENNKQEFEQLTERLAGTHFFGHEHVQSAYVTENKNTDSRINLLSGEVFNDDKKGGKSGFQILIVDVAASIGGLFKYDWNGSLYVSGVEKKFDVVKEVETEFNPLPEFLNRRMEVKIPLILEGKKNVLLSDIYVFPDIELVGRESRTFDNYIDARRLLDLEHEHCILDGESQVGKTSLITMLFHELVKRGIYPVILTGAEIKDSNVDKFIRRAFRAQYGGSQSETDRYMQLTREKRAILIDDYQDCELNTSATKQFFDEAKAKSAKVIAIFDSANSVRSSTRSVVDGAKYYSIKPLGYKKRNELIEKYLRLKQNPLTAGEQDFLEQVKELFDNVQSILGDKLMPPNPVYVLSIIQALQYKPVQQNETSFGYCYQTLIHYSLHKAGAANEDIDSYFNFLTELAYHLIAEKKEYISSADLTIFYTEYAKKFLCAPYEVMLGTLKRSKIIQSEDNGYKFCYNYILYYMSAKKIADMLHTARGREIVDELFEDLHLERNANILVFITHHSKDISFIESSLISMMEVLEHSEPITLEKTDAFYHDISEFVQTLKSDVLENRDPVEERKRQLESQDKATRRSLREPADEAQTGEKGMKRAVLPYLRSFRSMEIVGQILKNRKGSLEISQMRDMLFEAYTTAFRTIGYYGDLFDSLRSDVVEMAEEKVAQGDGKREIGDSINDFIQMTSFKMLLSVFIKLMHSVGSKELKQLYLDVAARINTPAAKIITFSINSYHGTINLKELTDLVNELKGNIVALRLVKARVLSYVYNRHVEYDTKQKLASILGLTLAPGIPGRRE